MDEYLTTDQIAQRLGVKVATVRRWVHQGKLHGLSLGRAGYRILQEDFDRFVQRRNQQLQQLTHSPPPNGRDEFPIEAISTLILERMTDGVLLFGPDGLCQYVNESAAQILDLSPNSLLGKTKVQVLSDRADIFRQDADGSSDDFFSTASGRWFQVRTFETPQGCCLTFFDITDRKLLEAQLRESHAEIQRQWHFFDRTLANISGFVFVWNRDKQFVYANQALEQLWGIERGAAVGKTTADLGYPPELSELLGRHIEQVFKTGEDVTDEVPYTSPTGVSGYYEYILSPIFAADGSVEFVAGTSLESTKRRLMEQALRESEERLRALANSMPQLAWSARSDGVIDFFNERVNEYAGIPQNEEGIFEWQAIIHPDDRASTIHDWERAVWIGSVFEHELRLRMKDGTYRWHLARGLPACDANGSVLRWYGTQTDIEQLKRLEKQKNDFLGVVSHELKTPVTSVKAFAEVLESRFRKAGDAKNASLLGKMHAQMEKLTLLIGDLLDVTRLEAGKLQFHEDFFAFDDLVKGIIEEVQRTTTLNIQREGTTNASVFGDRERIGQVLTNLLTNAIKYSPNATKVVVTCSCTSQEVTLCVQDFGIGISKEKLSHVFERFFRVAGSREDTFPGLGLGLYISAEIIQRHAGKIWVESEKGRGSTFCFTLPLQETDM